MRALGRSVITTVLVSTASACASPTDTVPVIAFSVTRTPNTDTATDLGFRFSVENSSSETVFFSACDGRIRPDITVAPDPEAPYVFNEAYCLGGTVLLAPLAAGASVAGAGSIPRVAGARYTPSIAYVTERRAGAPGRRVTGAEFEAP